MRKYFDTLGLSMDASPEQIKKAYRELSKKYHPDVNINNPLSSLAEEKFQQINEAYGIIKEYMKNNANSSENTKNKAASDSKKKKVRTDVEKEMIYKIVQKYVIETQVNPSSVKFPDIYNIEIIDLDETITIESFFSSKNWVDESIKTKYKIVLNSNLKMRKLDFLETSKEKSATKTFKKRPQNQNEQFTFKFKHVMLIFIIILIGFSILWFKDTNISSTTVTPPVSVVEENVTTPDIENENLTDTSEISKEEEKTEYTPSLQTPSGSFGEDTLAKLKEKVDVENPITREFYLGLASKSPGKYNIGQLAYIYTYLYTNWKYVSDPRGREYFKMV